MATITVSYDNGEFHVACTFGDEITLDHVFTLDEMPESTVANAVRIGLSNIIKDSWAGHGNEDVKAYDLARAKIRRLDAGTVVLSTRGPRIPLAEKHRRAYCTEILVKNGVKMGGLKVADQLVHIDELYNRSDRNRAKIDAEVAKRVAASELADDDGFDLDDGSDDEQTEA